MKRPVFFSGVETVAPREKMASVIAQNTGNILKKRSNRKADTWGDCRLFI